MEQRKYTGLDASLCTQWTKERHQGVYFPPKLLLEAIMPLGLQALVFQRLFSSTKLT